MTTFKLKEKDFILQLEKDKISSKYNVLNLVFDVLVYEITMRNTVGFYDYVMKVMTEKKDTVALFDDAIAGHSLITLANRDFDVRRCVDDTINGIDSSIQMQIMLSHTNTAFNGENAYPNWTETMVIACQASASEKIKIINIILNYFEKNAMRIPDDYRVYNGMSIALIKQWYKVCKAKVPNEIMPDLDDFDFFVELEEFIKGAKNIGYFSNPLMYLTCFNVAVERIVNTEYKAMLSEILTGKAGTKTAGRLLNVYGMEIFGVYRSFYSTYFKGSDLVEAFEEVIFDEETANRLKVSLTRDGIIMPNLLNRKNISVGTLDFPSWYGKFIGKSFTAFKMLLLYGTQDCACWLCKYQHSVEMLSTLSNADDDLCCIKETNARYEGIIEKQKEEMGVLSNKIKELQAETNKVAVSEAEEDAIFNELVDRVASLEKEVNNYKTRLSKIKERGIDNEELQEELEGVETLETVELEELLRIDEIKKHSFILYTGKEIPRITEELGVEQRIIDKSTNISNLVAKDLQTEYVGVYTRMIGHRCVERIKMVTGINKTTFFMLNNTNFSIVVNSLYNLISVRQ